MSGITTGTRLQRLEKLLAKVQQEITAERHRLAELVPERVGSLVVLPELVVAGDIDTHRRIRDHAGTTPPYYTGEVREWARANGYLVGDRGRIAADIVEAYLAAERDDQ